VTEFPGLTAEIHYVKWDYFDLKLGGPVAGLWPIISLIGEIWASVRAKEHVEVTTEREKLNLDELVRQLMGSIPDSLRAVGDDLENNFRGLLKSGLERMDLVTREEFDLQVAVLERTRMRLEALEVELKRLEDRLGSGPH